ncbi:MAG: ABC transporter [Ruminococcaceae bacterium]|nr:ABC transporter [Oscillospiraceae bacterium]
MIAIFKREFKSYFTSPVGYIFLAIMFFFLGLQFRMAYSDGVADVALTTGSMNSYLLFLVPIITMKLLSEDRHSKVDQALLTAPVPLSGIIFGKFLAAFAVYCISFAPTVIFEMIAANLVEVNVGAYLYMLFGMLLFGATLIAIGLFISSLTESTSVAAIATLIVNLLIMLMPNIVYWIESSKTSVTGISVKWISDVVLALQNGLVYLLDKLTLTAPLDQFYLQIITLGDMVYYLSFIAAFLFLSVRSLEKRRWA